MHCKCNTVQSLDTGYLGMFLHSYIIIAKLVHNCYLIVTIKEKEVNRTLSLFTTKWPYVHGGIEPKSGGLELDFDFSLDRSAMFSFLALVLRHSLFQFTFSFHTYTSSGSTVGPKRSEYRIEFYKRVT